jgi:hypothetical protein
MSTFLTSLLVFLLSLQVDGNGGGEPVSTKGFCKKIKGFRIDSLRDVSIVDCALEGYAAG